MASDSQIILVEARWENLSEKEALLILNKLENKAEKMESQKKKHYVLIAKNVEDKNNFQNTNHPVYDLAKLVGRPP